VRGVCPPRSLPQQHTAASSHCVARQPVPALPACIRGPGSRLVPPERLSGHSAAAASTAACVRAVVDAFRGILGQRVPPTPLPAVGPRAGTMSDGISRIELKNSTGYGRYQDSQGEESGLLGTAVDMGPAVAEQRKQYDDQGLLPVMIENGLEKIGVL